MNREELEQRLARAGWNLDGSFSGYLLIGYTDDLSVLVPEEACETNDPIFEIIEHERNATYWVREILPPSRPKSCSRSTASYPRCERTDLLRGGDLVGLRRT